MSEGLPYTGKSSVALITSGAVKCNVPTNSAGACNEFVNESVLRAISTANPKSANFTL